MDRSGADGAVEFGLENGQIAIWDTQEGQSSVAIWSEEDRAAVALSNTEARIVLACDPALAREWQKWNAMTRVAGRVVVIDRDRCEWLLAALSPGCTTRELVRMREWTEEGA
ncbi:MAG TPA: hypothetical protein VI409_08350 [Gaiellaceae bacterium]|nr:hypothetical protein [Gaiellaceae bacterium]